MNEIEEVLAQGRKRAQAMIRGDVAAIGAILDERLLYTHSSGLTDTRESYLAALNRQEYVYHSVETLENDHAVVDGRFAFVTSLMMVSMTVRSSGQTLSRKIKVTEVWTTGNTEADWRLLVSHSSNIP